MSHKFSFLLMLSGIISSGTWLILGIALDFPMDALVSFEETRAFLLHPPDPFILQDSITICSKESI